LIFVNYGGGTATDLIEFSDQVQRRVADQYAIQLEREPSVVS
jgi:UDP-N-acetylenolpyruvoylglucosamine reductase